VRALGPALSVSWPEVWAGVQSNVAGFVHLMKAFLLVLLFPSIIKNARRWVLIGSNMVMDPKARRKWRIKVSCQPACSLGVGGEAAGSLALHSVVSGTVNIELLNY
jgi:hypothetical protein